jgi:hypothetical protein
MFACPGQEKVGRQTLYDPRTDHPLGRARAPSTLSVEDMVIDRTVAEVYSSSYLDF